MPRLQAKQRTLSAGQLGERSLANGNANATDEDEI